MAALKSMAAAMPCCLATPSEPALVLALIDVPDAAAPPELGSLSLLVFLPLDPSPDWLPPGGVVGSAEERGEGPPRTHSAT